jgi:hypothetical protein
MSHHAPPAEAFDDEPAPMGRRRRVPLVIGIAIVAVALLGGTALAIVRPWAWSSANPAELAT